MTVCLEATVEEEATLATSSVGAAEEAFSKSEAAPPGDVARCRARVADEGTRIRLELEELAGVSTPIGWSFRVGKTSTWTAAAFSGCCTLSPSVFD